MPICRLMMNSNRARPTPAFGSRENANAWSGVPVHHDLHRNVGHLRRLGRLHRETQDSVVDETGVTLGAGTVTGRPSARSRSHCRCRPPRGSELAGDDRRVAGPATTVGDDRRRPFHDRLPVRVGHVRDQHLAGDELMHRIDRLKDTDRSGAIRCPIARPSTSTGPLWSIRKRCTLPTACGTARSPAEPAGCTTGRRHHPYPTRCPSAARNAPRSPQPAAPSSSTSVSVRLSTRRSASGTSTNSVVFPPSGPRCSHLGRLTTDSPFRIAGSPRLQRWLVHVELIRVDRPCTTASPSRTTM